MRIRSGPNNSCKISLSRLPKEYQEVEYIESTGTQYIDTLVNTDSNLGIDCHVNFGTLNFFGAIKDNNGTYLRHHAYNNYYHYGNPTYTILNNDSTFELDVVNKKIYQNSTTINMTSQIFDTGLTYWLFGRNSNNAGLKYYSSGKLYYFKMKASGVLIRDFIPCYRKSDSEIGLYDTVGQQFYTNQGTGTFSKGSNKFTSFSCKIPG